MNVETLFTMTMGNTKRQRQLWEILGKEFKTSYDCLKEHKEIPEVVVATLLNITEKEKKWLQYRKVAKPRKAHLSYLVA